MHTERNLRINKTLSYPSNNKLIYVGLSKILLLQIKLQKRKLYYAYKAKST
jgi:hypothetical protein